ncbi:hypothetical protein AB0C74_27070 [Spirillospora sp. NPDC048832]|jgi:hypothetical protein
MYGSLEEFSAAATAAKPRYERAGLPRLDQAFSPEGLNVAWCVYHAAALASRQDDDRGLIIGRLADPERQGAVIDQRVKDNFRTMNEATKDSGQGAVLDSPNWTFLVNDAWVLGGLHLGAPFYLASPRSVVNIYDLDEQHLTVFGRELCALTSFGYAFESPWPQLGEVAAYQGGPHCESADFAQLQDHAYRLEQDGRWNVLVDQRT